MSSLLSHRLRGPVAARVGETAPLQALVSGVQERLPSRVVVFSFFFCFPFFFCSSDSMRSSDSIRLQSER